MDKQFAYQQSKFAKQRTQRMAVTRPTLKTGRGYGQGKKVRNTQGFSLMAKFRTHSHDIVETYDIEDHIDKEDLKQKNFSPKHQDYHEKMGSLKNMRSRTRTLVGRKSKDGCSSIPRMV